MRNTGAVRSTLIAVVCWISFVAQAAAAAPKTINIPAGPLVAALELLQRQTAVELVYRPEQLSSFRTRGLSGTYSAQDAVRILLEGTPLELRVDSSGAMVIVPAGAPVSQPHHNNPAAGSAATEVGAAQSPGPPAMLEEIVVTAQKRSENILSVPASVAFISAETLEAQHATQLQDYASYVAGLQVDSGGTPGQTTITLRGIAPLGSGAAVGTYIDDAPVGSSSVYSFSNSFQLDLLPYDLKGIEVLRGPQGTLYGASTMGGLVKYVLRSPDIESFHAAVGGDILGVQNGDGVGGGLRGVVNVPLIRGSLALRASAFYQDTPGFVDDPVRGERGINGLRQEGGRLALGWTPTSDLQVSLEGIFQHTSSDGNTSVALDPTASRPLLGDLTTNFAVAQPFEQTTEFVKSSLVWTLPVGVFTSVSSYSDTRNRQIQDASPAFVTLFPLATGAPGVSPQLVDVRLHKYTEEVRLASASEQRVAWMIGGFATYEAALNKQDIEALGLDLQPNLLNPILTASLPTRYREQAVFANLTGRLIGGWSISPGVRYSHNSQNYEQITGGLLSPGDPESGKSAQNVTTYSVSSQFQFTPSEMIYVRVASGYEPGGPNVALQGIPPTVEASTLMNYEAGFKSEMLQDRLMLDIALFRMNWKKIQTTAVTQTGLQYLLNAGEARSQGLEAAASWRATQQLTLATSLAYTDATFTTGIANLGTVSGQRLPAVPRFSASVGPQYRVAFQNGWDAQFGAGVRYVSSRLAYTFVAPAPPVTFDEKSYFALDLNAHAQHGDWRLGVFAKNLLDRRAYLTDTGVPDAVTGAIVQVNSAFLQPRTIGFSIDRAF
jgi:iron complex outermembrane receptor protein